MMENKFTPRAEESLRLAQEAAEEMATFAPQQIFLIGRSG